MSLAVAVVGGALIGLALTSAGMTAFGLVGGLLGIAATVPLSFVWGYFVGWTLR